MNREAYIKQILMFLGAYPHDVLKEALQRFTKAKRERRLAEGLEIWTKDGTPPPPYEWAKVGSLIYYRLPDPSEKVTKTSKEEAHHPDRTTAQRELKCPKCGDRAFRSPVCPNCAKGKAGIRNQYICGECNFVFYTEG
ncbi:MAG: hypothetical protein RBR16_07710 [Syntrophus sp. (in: bacteria)]|jgi:ribosomal protein L32|nr:hypothetical protein [Syntrophus sp. (in: bacteria)]